MVTTVFLTQYLVFWWEVVDSNHRRRSQRIYSPPHLAALETSHKYEYRTIGQPLGIACDCGAGGRNRTNNRLITSQMLYH